DHLCDRWWRPAGDVVRGGGATQRAAEDSSAFSEFGRSIAAVHRSPTLRIRSGTVSIVKSSRARSDSSSAQSSGGETVAYGFARAAYTPATVLPRIFWR